MNPRPMEDQAGVRLKAASAAPPLENPIVQI